MPDRVRAEIDSRDQDRVLREFRRENDRSERVLRRPPSPNARLTTQQGGTTAGSGRGAFSGNLRDFLSRDEFTGRTGTIFRGLSAGNLVGAGLAFVSVDEFFRTIMDALRGKDAEEILSGVVNRLVPSILRESIPAILDEADRRSRASLVTQANDILRQVDFQRRLAEDPDFAAEVARSASVEVRNAERFRREQAENVAWEVF